MPGFDFGFWIWILDFGILVLDFWLIVAPLIASLIPNNNTTTPLPGFIPRINLLFLFPLLSFHPHRAVTKSPLRIPSHLQSILCAYTSVHVMPSFQDAAELPSLKPVSSKCEPLPIPSSFWVLLARLPSYSLLCQNVCREASLSDERLQGAMNVHV